MYKFNIRDKVRVIHNPHLLSGERYIGKVGTILAIKTSPLHEQDYALLDIDIEQNGIWLEELEPIKKEIKLTRFAKFIMEIETKKGEDDVDS